MNKSLKESGLKVWTFKNVEFIGGLLFFQIGVCVIYGGNSF